MLSVAHTLISLPFGVYLTNPWLIFFAAALFHLFCDTLLHWNIYPDQMKKYPVLAVALDVLGGLVLAWLALGTNIFTLPILAAIAGGNMPDVLHGLWELFGRKKTKATAGWHIIFRWHDSLQKETNQVFPGLASQIILIGIALCLIL